MQRSIAAIVASARLQLPVARVNVNAESSLTSFDTNSVGLDTHSGLDSGPVFAHIKLLDLSNNGIGIEGADILAAAFKSPHVCIPERLLLAGNRLGQQGVACLSMALGEKMRQTGGSLVVVRRGLDKDKGASVQYTELMELDLSHNSMGESGLDKLCGCLSCVTTLQVYSCTGTNVQIHLL